MDRMTRVFVYETTSADPLCPDAALASQGRSMRDAMVADLAMLEDVQVSCAVGVDNGSATPERVRPLRQAVGETAVDFLRQQAARHDLVWVVAPESDGLLSSLRAAVADHQWLGCSRRAIEVAGSKRATALHLRAAGIAATEPLDLHHPPAAGIDARVDAGIDAGINAGKVGDWIVKPDDGCGASGARRHADYARACADLAGRRLRHEEAVMEPWIDGEPLSMALLCSPDHAEVLTVSRQRISFDAAGFLCFEGVSIGAVTGPQAQAMAALGRRIWTALPGLCGFVGIDVTWHPERGPVVIEINPRVTCAYEGLSGMLGRNVAQQVLALHRRMHGAADSDAIRVANPR
jgi:predicted ATP-grasp superfamily ATP-dependent carboligase